MLTVKEKIQELLNDEKMKGEKCFYLIVLDKNQPAFFVNAFKVDAVTHAVTPLVNVVDSASMDETESDDRPHRSRLRPSVRIYDARYSVNILFWHLNRGKKKGDNQQRIVIRQKYLLGGPVFFYNTGSEEITIGYRHNEKLKNFQSFVIPSGEVISDPVNPPLFYNPIIVRNKELLKMIWDSRNAPDPTF